MMKIHADDSQHLKWKTPAVHLPDSFGLLEDFLHVVLIVAAAEILTAIKAGFIFRFVNHNGNS